MPLVVGDLLDEADLGLRLRTAQTGLDRLVRWAAVTELADPTPWMDGGELILTTGLRQRTAVSQTEFVELVAGAGGAAIGFGTGLSHTTIPRATVAAAQRLGVAVLEVPYRTPFIAITRLVAERVLAEDRDRQRLLVDRHDLLVQTLLSGGGLNAMATVLKSMLRCGVAITDRQGMVLACAPRAAVSDLGGAAEIASGERRPIEIDGEVVAYLCVGFGEGLGSEEGGADAAERGAAEGVAAGSGAGRFSPGSPGSDVLPFALRLIGLEIARRQAELAGRRELAGQVLEDVLRDLIAPSVAERRLAGLGVFTDAPYRVVIGSLAPGAGRPRDAYRLAHLMWAGPDLPRGPGGVVSAVVQRYLVALIPDGIPSSAVTGPLSTALMALDASATVGVGGAYSGVEGLRWSYFEARAALDKGPGVHTGDPLNLPRLLMSNPDLPLRQFGAEVLRPLTEFDAANQGELVATLHAYLSADCSVATVTKRLFVHRNTVRYRLDQIERLTGRSLATTVDRVQLWLALLAIHQDPE
jgi:purine catabolism regulator